MIEVKNLSKAFSGKVVLEDVSCQMQKGKINLIIGASGSGKSVFMKCIIGLIIPEKGEILYEGKDLLEMNKDEKKELRKNIGMLFQGSALFDSMTVEQNIQFPLNMFTDLSLDEKRKQVDEVLARVNIADANKKYPSEISGGMKKRVALARAIVLKPKYLFCDEPNSGLDPKTSLVIDRLIMDLTQEYNITTVVNTHDMNTVLESGDNILFLHQGKKEWEGNNQEIIFNENQILNDFIFASDFLRDAKQKRMNELK
jgi:phospholipid/cholesterol/gamma-HCH transport system ATP-binding protein